MSKECDSLDIGFHLELGTPPDIITKSFLEKYKIGLIVSDFSPLRLYFKAMKYMPLKDL